MFQSSLCIHIHLCTMYWITMDSCSMEFLLFTKIPREVYTFCAILHYARAQNIIKHYLYVYLLYFNFFGSTIFFIVFRGYFLSWVFIDATHLLVIYCSWIFGVEIAILWVVNRCTSLKINKQIWIFQHATAAKPCVFNSFTTFVFFSSILKIIKNELVFDCRKKWRRDAVAVCSPIYSWNVKLLSLYDFVEIVDEKTIVKHKSGITKKQ